MNGLSFKKRYESLKPKEFKEVYTKGKKVVTDYFVLFLLNRKAEFKVGVVASRKIGKSVKRNRAKRRLREIVRLSQHEIPKDVWIVLIARKGIFNAEFKVAKDIFIRKVNEIYKIDQHGCF